MTTEAKINRFIEGLERNKRLTRSFLKIVTELEEEGFDLAKYMADREKRKMRNNRREAI